MVTTHKQRVASTGAQPGPRAGNGSALVRRL